MPMEDSSCPSCGQLLNDSATVDASRSHVKTAHASPMRDSDSQRSIKFRETPVEILVASLFTLVLGGVVASGAQAFDDESIAGICILLGGVLLLLGVVGLLKVAFVSARGKLVVLERDKVRWGSRLSGFQEENAHGVHWEYQPYVHSGMFGAFVNGFLSVTAGLYLRFPSGARLHVCPGVLSAKDAKYLIKKLEPFAGPLPDFVLNPEATPAGPPARLVPTDTELVIGNTPDSDVPIAGLSPFRLLLRYDRAAKKLHLVNQSESETFKLQIQTEPQNPRKIAPGEDCRLDAAPRSDGKWERHSIVVQDMTLHLETLADGYLYVLPFWRNV